MSTATVAGATAPRGGRMADDGENHINPKASLSKENADPDFRREKRPGLAAKRVSLKPRPAPRGVGPRSPLSPVFAKRSRLMSQAPRAWPVSKKRPVVIHQDADIENKYSGPQSGWPAADAKSGGAVSSATTPSLAEPRPLSDSEQGGVVSVQLALAANQIRILRDCLLDSQAAVSRLERRVAALEVDRATTNRLRAIANRTILENPVVECEDELLGDGSRPEDAKSSWGVGAPALGAAVAVVAAAAAIRYLWSRSA